MGTFTVIKLYIVSIFFSVDIFHRYINKFLLIGYSEQDYFHFKKKIEKARFFFINEYIFHLLFHLYVIESSSFGLGVSHIFHIIVQVSVSNMGNSTHLEESALIFESFLCQ